MHGGDRAISFWSPTLKRWAAILGLGLALVCAQSIAVAHDFDLDSHTPDHTCEICIATASLGSANALPDAVAASLCHDIGRGPRTLRPADTPAYSFSLARAPPTAD